MHVELKTQRLLLRPLELADLEAVHAYASDRENTRFMLFLPNDTLEETAAFLKSVEADWAGEQPQAFEFAVVLGSEVIGAVSVALNDERTEGEMGWILNKRYWGKGYTTEAALAVRDFAIRELGVKKLIAHCDARNTASQRVMQKLSFRLEGETDDRVYPKTGEKATERMYSLRVAD